MDGIFEYGESYFMNRTFRAFLTGLCVIGFVLALHFWLTGDFLFSNAPVEDCCAYVGESIF